MRDEVLRWMERRQWHLRWPRTFKFWEWVVMPLSSGGRLGFVNWLRWVMR